MDAVFDRNRYFGALGTDALGRTLFDFASIGSTNAWLLERAFSLPHGAAAVAQTQTAGRGRRGKLWLTPPGASLALSVLLRNPACTALLPLLCACAVCDACSTLCGLAVRVKWPNDIVYQGKKLCGILCEARAASNSSAAVCGFGLNLTQDAAAFARMGLPWAVSLQMAAGLTVLPEDAAAAVLTALEAVLARAAAGEDLLAGYRARCVTLGRAVRFTRASGGGEEETGTAVGIAPDGALLVERSRCSGNIRCDGSGTEVAKLHAGEVSVRGVYGYV